MLIIVVNHIIRSIIQFIYVFQGFKLEATKTTLIFFPNRIQHSALGRG